MLALARGTRSKARGVEGRWWQGEATGRRCPVGQAMKEEATAQLLRDDFRVSKRSRLTAWAATRSGARVRGSAVHGGDSTVKRWRVGAAPSCGAKVLSTENVNA